MDDDNPFGKDVGPKLALVTMQVFVFALALMLLAMVTYQ